MASNSVLVGVAWPYANGPRHIGHVAGFAVPSDVFSRYQRMAGKPVLMVSGTDEHGTPIQVQADAEGVTPKELADRYNRVIVEDLAGLNTSYDLFTRTTTENHYRVVQQIFTALLKNGYIEERLQLLAFSPTTGRNLPDRYVEGTCPHCSDSSARGDQCDNCGSQLDPQELIDPRSRVNGEVPVFRESPQLFLELPAFATQLGDWLATKSDWRASVGSFSASIVHDLKPRAITRNLDWGVPIPMPGYGPDSKQRLYVWFDAVIGYLSASIEWARRSGDEDAWKQWWSPDSESYYFMGKDNTVFHSVIWPSILLGAGHAGPGREAPFGSLSLPTEVVASEYLTTEGRKFSSSRSVVIYLRDFLERYGADSLRYYLAANGPESSDADFTWEHFAERNNNELVAGWGNLVSRAFSLTLKSQDKIPEPGSLTDRDKSMLSDVESAFDTVGDLYGRSRFRAATSEAMKAVARVNRFLSDEEPWKTRESDPSRFDTVMSVVLQAVSDCNVLLSPVLPTAADSVASALGLGAPYAGSEIVEVQDLDRDGATYPTLQQTSPTTGSWGRANLEAGTPLKSPGHLFQKLDDAVVQEELARLGE